MKIKIRYQSVVDGDYTIEADVSEEIYNVIEEYERKEENYERRERYHHNISQDGVDYEGIDLASKLNLENLVLAKKLNKDVANAFRTLTDVQKRRLMLYASGYKYIEIAKLENASITCVFESVQMARKKILKKLNKF